MRRFIRTVVALGLFALLALPTTSFAQDAPALLRVMHAAPNAPAVDVYVNEVPILRGLSFFALSEYLSLPAGEYTIQVTPANAGLENAVITDQITINSGNPYTIVAFNQGDDVLGFILEDNQSAPPVGETRVNLYHAAVDAPAVDVKIAGTDTTVATGLSFMNAASLTVPAGTYQFDITPAGSSQVVYTTPSLNFLSGWGYTLAATGFLEQPDSFAVQARVDYTSPSELAITPPSQPEAMVYVAELRALNTGVTE